MNFIKRQHDIPSQLVLVTPPDADALCVPLLAMKKHCRLPEEETYTDDDDLLKGFHHAAVKLVESHAEIGLLTQEWRLDLQALPGIYRSNSSTIIRLEKKPVVSVEVLQYYRPDNEVAVVIDDADYRTYLSSNPPELWVKYDKFTNDLDTDRMDAIQVEFTVGVAPAEDDNPAIPPAAKQAILLLVATYFQKRELVHLWSGKALVEMPYSYQSLIESLRWRL